MLGCSSKAEPAAKHKWWVRGGVKSTMLAKPRDGQTYHLKVKVPIAVIMY